MDQQFNDAMRAHGKAIRYRIASAVSAKKFGRAREELDSLRSGQSMSPAEFLVVLR